MLNLFKTDLHIHSCLSPCGDWDMSPQKIVQKSLKAGLDLIAICDHNSTENAAAAMREGTQRGLNVLPGMEICSKEEVHILAVFDGIDQALQMQQYVYANLPGENNPEVFGYQVVANEHDEVLGENPRLLIGATILGLEDIINKTHLLEGLSIACHVDRPAYGIINQLGFIPDDLPLDAVEVSFRIPPAQAAAMLPEIKKRPCVTSSDAHFTADIGKAYTVFQMAAATLTEIRLALAGKKGRRIQL